MKTRLSNFEKQSAVFIDQHDRLQKNLAEAEDKIGTLRHEKLFLAQEKSELQGYLKQLKEVN